MRPLKPALCFLIDSREQVAFRFGRPVRKEFRDGGTLIKGLSEGDYSVCIDSGAPLLIRLERKSHTDLLACVGRERERFERELGRLAAICGGHIVGGICCDCERVQAHGDFCDRPKYDRKAIILEASADDILRGHERSQVSPRAAMASLCCWYSRFGVAFIFGENHRRAGGIAQRILEEYALHYLEGKRHADSTGDARQVSKGLGRDQSSDSIRAG